MRKNELHEAMERMHAAEDTYERVMERASAGCRRGRGPLPAAAVIGAAVAGVLATGGVAYAVAGGDFFDRVWGDHGTDGRVEWSYMGNNYSQEYGSLDPAAVSDDLASSVEAVGLSVTGNGYTLTIEDMLVDENGCGAVTFTLENPDGIQNNPEYGLPGELLFYADDNASGREDGMQQAIMSLASKEYGGVINQRWIYDKAMSTATELHGTVYFATFDGEFGSVEELLSGVYWELDWWEGDKAAGESVSAGTDVFRPTKLVSMSEFTDEAGNAASISPFSMKLDVAWPGGEGDGVDAVTLVMADGTTYEVYGEGIVNYYAASRTEDGALKLNFTRFVNVGEVASVRVTGTTVDSHGGETEHEVTLAPRE